MARGSAIHRFRPGSPVVPRPRLLTVAILLAAAAAIILAGSVLLLRPASDPSLRCDVRAVARIPPGTQIADRAPRGFTHLIFKSRSELKSGELDELHELAIPLTETLFTAMVARVGHNKARGRASHRIEEVAVGLGTRVGEQDVIISGSTQHDLGADLGPLERILLAEAERQLGRTREIAGSDTMRIIDAPNIMLREGRHRDVILRYVFLVHPQDGRLLSLVWPVDVDSRGDYRLWCGTAVRLRPNLSATCPLHVDGSEVILGIPSPRAFAASRLPAGTQVPIPASLREIAGRRRLTLDEARQIEAGLRRAVGFSEVR